MKEETENKIIPYSQHYRCSFQLFEGKKTGILFQELFDQFLYNYRIHKTTGGIPLSVQRLVEATGIHRHSIKPALETLEESGVITLENNVCYINADYYISVVNLYSFAKKEQRELIKKAFKSHDIEELVKLGYIKKKLEDECIKLAKGDINVQNWTQMSKIGHECTKLDTDVENWTSNNNESCPKLDINVQNWTLMAETLWSDLSKIGNLEENYQPNLPYNLQDLESKMSVYVEMAKTGQFSTVPNGFMDVLMGIGGIVVARTMSKIGHCYGQNWTFYVQNCTFLCPKLDTVNIKEINKEKNEITSVSELYKGENKEKAEEAKGDRKLPDNNKNSLDSFLENSLGKSSSINQETSSEENNLDQEQSEETFQEEEIKVQEIPDWEETRDSNYPSFPAMEINNMIRYPRDYQEDIHELIRKTFELFEGDSQEYEEEASTIPCEFFERELEEIVEELKENNPEFSISFQDAKNIFFFEPVWNKANREFDYVVSSSSIHDITQAPKKSRKGKGGKRQKIHEAEKFIDAISQVADENLDDLTNLEYAILLMMDDIRARQENGEVLYDDYEEYQFWNKAMKWADDSRTPFDELAPILRTLPINLRHVTARPRLLNIEKIMDWNRKHSQESKVETLWKQKMAELQN